MSSSGADSGRTTLAGWRSNVTSTLSAPCASAEARTWSMTARCPTWTPSNAPMVRTARWFAHGRCPRSVMTCTDGHATWAPRRGTPLAHRVGLKQRARGPDWNPCDEYDDTDAGSPIDGYRGRRPQPGRTARGRPPRRCSRRGVAVDTCRVRPPVGKPRLVAHRVDVRLPGGRRVERPARRSLRHRAAARVGGGRVHRGVRRLHGQPRMDRPDPVQRRPRRRQRLTRREHQRPCRDQRRAALS